MIETGETMGDTVSKKRSNIIAILHSCKAGTHAVGSRQGELNAMILYALKIVAN